MIRAAMTLVALLYPVAAQAQSVPPPAPPAPPSSATPPISAVPVQAYARDAPIFPIGPIGTWEADRDVAGSCAVSRNYGSAERPVTVTILSGGAAQTLGIYVVSGATGAEPGSGKGAVVLAPGATTVSDYSSFDVPVRDQHFTVMFVDRAAFDGLATARALTIRGDRTTTIAAADMKAAIDMNDRCLVALYQSWGIDPARFGRGKPAPTPVGGNPGYWFDADDYPPAARRAGIQGRVVMVLDVAEDGLIKACRVVVSAGADLDAVSCQSVMKRGSFTPAKDAQGKPVASWAIIPVRWSLQQ
ncbi:hypothetical protein GCM10009087_52430 [Sphingomonas oligophenolica]